MMTDDRDVTPLDLLHGANYTDRATRDARLDTCRACDHYRPITRQCSRCGCLMPAKTWLTAARCPLGLWTPEGTP